MDLDSYFDFLAPDDIRIKGTRIGIESVLYEYIHRGQAPDAIAARFHTLDLEQIYATILYYLRNRAQLDAYLAEWLAFSQQAREAQELNPSPAILHLRQRKAEQQPVE
jgi:uncharacterized protein (DUF433 family)